MSDENRRDCGASPFVNVSKIIENPYFFYHWYRIGTPYPFGSGDNSDYAMLFDKKNKKCQTFQDVSSKYAIIRIMQRLMSFPILYLNKKFTPTVVHLWQQSSS